MNERIKELAEQAGLQLGIVIENSTTPVKTITIEQRKFAELIVRECAEIAYNKQYKHSAAHTRGDCAEAIKQHFGVEL